jgi:hypothetical protein
MRALTRGLYPHWTADEAGAMTRAKALLGDLGVGVTQRQGEDQSLAPTPEATEISGASSPDTKAPKEELTPNERKMRQRLANSGFVVLDEDEPEAECTAHTTYRTSSVSRGGSIRSGQVLEEYDGQYDQWSTPWSP